MFSLTSIYCIASISCGHLYKLSPAAAAGQHDGRITESSRTLTRPRVVVAAAAVVKGIDLVDGWHMTVTHKVPPKRKEKNFLVGQSHDLPSYNNTANPTALLFHSRFTAQVGYTACCFGLFAGTKERR